MSLLNVAWRTLVLKSDKSTWRITCEHDLPLALFRVQLGSLHANNWCEDLKATWGRDLLLAVFMVQLGHSDTHKRREGLKTTGRDLPLALFRVQLGHLNTQQWCEGLKTTWGYDLPLTPFKIQLGHLTPMWRLEDHLGSWPLLALFRVLLRHSDTFKWSEDLKTTLRTWLISSLFPLDKKPTRPKVAQETSNSLVEKVSVLADPTFYAPFVSCLFQFEWTWQFCLPSHLCTYENL